MNIPECHREQEVLEAVRAGRWSGAWGEELRKHAAACPVCAEVALVAAMLLEERDLAQAEVRLPSAGLVWWKAQRAARRAAEERATQPIALVERAAWALTLFGVFGLALWQWPRIAGWLGGAKSLASGPGSASSSAQFTAQFTERVVQTFQSLAQGLGAQSSGYLVIASVGAVLALMGFAAYVVWREE
jgi:hypothetical protein